ncbi:MAG: hypothetical protein V1929_11080 [bacterium]
MTEPRQIHPMAHVRVVLTVLLIFIAAAVAARWLAYPKSFGLYGHYRGDAVRDAMYVRTPLYVGIDRCAECHEDQVVAKQKDVHENVACETCHGAGGAHMDDENGNPVARPDAKPLIVSKTTGQCLTCHRRLEARPASFPQIDREEHFAMLHVTDTNAACSMCHDPHEPLFLDTNIRQARLHPVMNECVDCHKHKQDKLAEKPARHPVLFECSYCHKAIAKDYSTRAHKDLRCGICHQTYPVSDRAVRIIKHRDPRFCLLCHSDKPAKDDNVVPTIAWPAHLEDMADDFEKDKDKVCADCHREAFHLEPTSRDELVSAPEGGDGHE